MDANERIWWRKTTIEVNEKVKDKLKDGKFIILLKLSLVDQCACQLSIGFTFSSSDVRFFYSANSPTSQCIHIWTGTVSRGDVGPELLLLLRLSLLL